MAFSIDGRAQLLANCKLLYGPDTEVFTIISGNSCYQAFAMRYDPLSGSWTKFLHITTEHDTYNALSSLLGETEIELAKLLSANGIEVPFSGDPVQNMTLDQRVRNDPGAISNARPEATKSEYVAIPESGSLEEEAVAATSEELENIKPAEPDPSPKLKEGDGFGFGLTSVTKGKKKKKRGLIKATDEWMEESPAPVEELPCEENGGPSWFTSAMSENKSKTGDSAPIPEPEASVPDEVKDERAIPLKKDKKKKIKRSFEPEPAVVIMEGDENPAPFLDPTGDKSTSVADCQGIPEPEIAEEEEPPDDICSLSRKDKNKKKVVASIPTPPPEPEPLAAEEAIDHTWWPPRDVSKKKKKKNKDIEPQTLSEPEPVPEPEPEQPDPIPVAVAEPLPEFVYPEPAAEPEPVPEPEYPMEEDVLHLSKRTSKRGKNKKGRKVAFETIEPGAEPGTEQASGGWDFCGNIKDRESPVVAEDPIPDSETLIVEAEPMAVEDRWRSPTQSDAKETHITQPLAGFTIVLRILHASKTSEQVLETMVTLANNTRGAILDMINLYLDSKTPLMHTSSQRKIEIKSGVGKNGDIDLSNLDESRWPESLEYFRQFTKLPELTVDVVDPPE